MTRPETDRYPLLVLRVGALCCFAAWAWVHLYWEGPYGVLLWQDGTYALAERLGISWDEFVGSGADDGWVQKWLGRIGWLYLICALATLPVGKKWKSRLQMAILIAGSGLLIVLSYAKYLAAQRQLPMFVEHGGQMLGPVILVLALALGVRHHATVITATLAVIMTFAGHGAYALGYHWPTPANFFGMTTLILQVEPGTARGILYVAGVLDLLVCIGLLIPRVRRSAALYAVVWGFLTAIARPVAGMSLDLNYWGADQYLHEAVLRAPHFMIPLFLFLAWKKTQTADAAAKPALLCPGASGRHPGVS